MISKKCAECNNKERLQAAVEGFNQRKPLCLFLRTTVVLYSSTSLVLKQIFKLFVLSLLFSMSFVTVLEESQKAEINMIRKRKLR
ncbi:Chitin synthase [Trichinella pseudospiralis]